MTKNYNVEYPVRTMRKRERLKLRELKWKNNDRFATEKVKDREREGKRRRFVILGKSEYTRGYHVNERCNECPRDIEIMISADHSFCEVLGVF